MHPDSGDTAIGGKIGADQGADDEGEVAKNIFAKYASKKGSPPSTKTTTEEEYDEEEDEDEKKSKAEDGEEADGINDWSKYSSKEEDDAGSSSSSFFKDFAKKNIGNGSFRRPKPKNDEDSEVAKNIFSKYASDGSTVSTATLSSPTPPGKKFTARSTASSSGLWPTPRPFQPKRGKITPVTPAHSAAPSESTTTSEVTLTSSTAPPPSSSSPTTASTSTLAVSQTLDTSSFLSGPASSGDFESAFVDLAKIPSNSQDGAMSIDTSSFSSVEDDSEAGSDAKPASPPVPIRKVLDVFQELKLAFGRREA
jgi:hypothetical protein